MEEGLLLIQKMHKEGSINDDQRDALKGKWQKAKSFTFLQMILTVVLFFEIVFLTII